MSEGFQSPVSWNLRALTAPLGCCHSPPFPPEISYPPVLGKRGEAYYTPYHYQTFRKLPVTIAQSERP